MRRFLIISALWIGFLTLAIVANTWIQIGLSPGADTSGTLGFVFIYLILFVFLIILSISLLFVRMPPLSFGMFANTFLVVAVILYVSGAIFLMTHEKDAIGLSCGQSSFLAGALPFISYNIKVNCAYFDGNKYGDPSRCDVIDKSDPVHDWCVKGIDINWCLGSNYIVCMPPNAR